ncbi:hypothetical protein A3A84_02425 [Candidatus Collierbacteria bacterium RIFCSPLOWO2_01_FULL_50_23]|uniref:Uncharacterized protein n=2 Tax=Candidatus Collieribacteriota TaxID=1752725 RepID=A0A1F5EX82_9BACT|nr:MAG: hypothetical protein A3D09_00880 [Candidatus Collierbacteria bacterium RIFCSPHIGHO2_02_FULL_49_10]OGD72263.1 MAG: hypothetical protein A2703_02775 [Candidatus Collierbacteria bacterium RIFCSPHIGHO2_01_FULL_50_25]OGD73814.1 MAG: hypothetical protein A3A84_02425 [Candidatus Collierbacteria bacterium RIFCSPLOWO2_01_FULL_50_23]
MDNPFLIFSFVFGLAVCAGMVARIFHQPAFLGHVLVGLLVGYWGLLRGGEINRFLEMLSSAGVMLLLFLVGLEMNVAEVKKMGEKALLIGFSQIVFTIAIFSLLLKLMGISLNLSLFLAAALTFSSTIIVVKLLSEKHDLESLAGKVAVALLLIQDLAAIVILLVLGRGEGNDPMTLSVKVLVLAGLTILMARRVMPKLLHKVARSMDELILFSLAWCFVLASLIASPVIGLSLEIGGFLAGLALSGSFEHSHIATKIKPIRDFFLTIFFVGLGLNLRLDFSIVITAIYLSLAVIFLKPIIIWFLMRCLGYKQRVAFNTGILFGQISEFSFIMVGIGNKVGLLNGSELSLVSLVGLITMVVSGYLILDNESVYRLMKPLLRFFWKDNLSGEDEVKKVIGDRIVLFGCHRMGRSLLRHLAKNKQKMLIVDFDPEAVSRLTSEGYEVIYADASDTEMYDRLNLTKAKMVISTLRDIKDNLIMLSELKRRRLRASVVMDAESVEDAQKLYAAGATYVIFPHFVGGLHLGDLIRKGVCEKEDFESYRKYQQEEMTGVYV